MEGQPLEFLSRAGNGDKPRGRGATAPYQAGAATDAQRRIASFLARHLER